MYLRTNARTGWLYQQIWVKYSYYTPYSVDYMPRSNDLSRVFLPLYTSILRIHSLRNVGARETAGAATAVKTYPTSSSDNIASLMVSELPTKTLARKEAPFKGKKPPSNQPLYRSLRRRRSNPSTCQTRIQMRAFLFCLDSSRFMAF